MSHNVYFATLITSKSHLGGFEAISDKLAFLVEIQSEFLVRNFRPPRPRRKPLGFPYPTIVSFWGATRVNTNTSTPDEAIFPHETIARRPTDYSPFIHIIDILMFELAVGGFVEAITARP